MTDAALPDDVISQRFAATETGRGWSALDALFTEVVADGRLSGAVALAWHQSDLVHSAQIGWQDKEARVPMAHDTLFRLYSMTKPVTAAAMMALWDDGLWSPDDPIARYLPELANLKVFQGVDDEGNPILGAPAVAPTLENLMTNQAGFTYGFSGDDVDRMFHAAGVPAAPSELTAQEYLRRVATVPLAYEPGRGWRYSIACDLQGIIVERLSGMSLRDFMQQRIFAPLGMTDTDFMVAPDKRDRLAALYTIAGDTTFVVPPGPFAPSYDTVPTTCSGGGGLVGSAPDYMRFARMLHAGGTLDGAQILSSEAVTLLRRSHTPTFLLDGTWGISPHWLRPGYEYAYNGIVVTDPEAADVALGLGTYFWDGAAGCWFWTDPEKDVVLVCMIQSLISAEVLGLQFRSRAIVAAILANGGR